MSNPDWIQSAEAAAILGYQQRTFNRHVLAGKIPVATKLDGPTGPRLFERSVIEALAAGEQALALRPKDIHVHTSMSRIWMERGDKTKAEHHGALQPGR